MIIEESMPYNFTITNTSSSKTETRTLLDAFEIINDRRKIRNFTFNNGMSYRAFLNYITENPFKVGRMYIQMIEGITSINQIVVKQRDEIGETFTNVLFPKLDPMQNLNNIYNFDVDIPVDGFTKIDFEMPPSSTIRVALYQDLSINKANNLIGKSEFTEYKMPNISQFLF